jgi:hypothetical protein
MAAQSDTNNTNSPMSGALLIRFLLQLHVVVKMAHWQTTSFAVHSATDALHDKLKKLTDAVVEEYSGKYGRPKMPSATTLVVPNMSRASLVSFLKDSIQYASTRFPKDGFMQNRRDELVGELSRAVYLLTMKQ